MYEYLLSTTARILSWLPLSLNQTLGSLIGRCAWLANTSLRRVTEVNLRLCYPDESEEILRTRGFRSLQHTGRQICECAWIWNRPHSQSLEKITQVQGLQLFEDAIASPRGLIMVSPHIGNWELTPLILSSKAPLTYFYRNPRSQVLAPLILKWRMQLGGTPIMLDPAGIREAFKLLKKGGQLGILPDQQPDASNGVFAPFFNQPALTMTLLSRLAQRSNAQVLYLMMERLPDGRGWQVRYLPADPDITHADATLAAAAVNRDVERCIAWSPDQYLWSYKRFSLQPDGTRRRYR